VIGFGSWSGTVNDVEVDAHGPSKRRDSRRARSFFAGVQGLMPGEP
jgi:hypothetical protein